jgi:DNA-binding GntR family transcriptional regulator
MVTHRRSSLKAVVAPQPVDPSPAPAAPAASGATERIVESITTAIVERRLMPGTKLVRAEARRHLPGLAHLVRQALNQLSRDRLVTLEPCARRLRGHAQRRGGAPGLRSARHARNVRWCASCAPHHRPADRRAARASARRKRRLWRAPTWPAAPGCWPTFHVVLARMLGNQVLAEILPTCSAGLADCADVPVGAFGRRTRWPSTSRWSTPSSARPAPAVRLMDAPPRQPCRAQPAPDPRGRDSPPSCSPATPERNRHST